MVFSCQAKPGAPIKIRKFMAYHTAARLDFVELKDCVDRSLDRAMSGGFEELWPASGGAWLTSGGAAMCALRLMPTNPGIGRGAATGIALQSLPYFSGGVSGR